MVTFDIDQITDYSDIYLWLSGGAEYRDDIINLLCMVSNNSKSYCENLLIERDWNFFSAYEKIIEDKFKKTLSN